jgi:GDPmannose 4,6-dehydratase
MSRLVAIITGVAGQDGSYLSEYLLELGYTVVGLSRRKSVEPGISNLDKVFANKNFIFVEGDLSDPTCVSRLLHKYKPHEFYNLGANSHVGQSFIEPLVTFKINAEAVLMHLEMIRQISPYTRYYQASTSELFGGMGMPIGGYTEQSVINPRSPYAIAKATAFYSVKNYREAYDVFACNGILFNHSSPRRGLDFATRKITNGVAKIRIGIQNKIKMGDLSAFRDEGHSKDYVKAMHLMLQNDKPDDFVIATNKGAKIADMLSFVANLAGYSIDEIYELDERFIRPSDVPYLLGNNSKAKEVLGWQPEYNWKSTLKEMYEQDLNQIQNILRS